MSFLFFSYPATLPIRTNSIGYKKTPSNVARVIPPNNAIPITLRASAPDPDAITNGNTPKIKEKAVINIGLNLDFAALRAASKRVNPFLNSSLANSTINIAFLAAIPINITNEIWAGPRAVIGASYMAKWFFPEKFKHFNPEEIHKEYINNFHNIKFQGKYAY